ncbi:MAG: methyltransferase domain-containing protein [Candidatus Competibacterales bacterium]|nr:methyltransferase domain-containing protein [Candidatus Competibacterales bacterium]
MSLRHSYTLFAPFYDPLIARATATARRRSLAALVAGPGERVLLVGIGSGLDIPLLAPGPDYVGLDLTPAMLRRARSRTRRSRMPVILVQGEAGALPFAAAGFAAVVLHLILAVAPRPERTLAEASRVLRPGGQMLIFDKFLRPGQRAPLRRLLSPLVAALATRTDVVFEPLLAARPELRLLSDRPALAGGWFRHLVLEKR